MNETPLQNPEPDDGSKYPPSKDFPIVGIGASAGGVEALVKFFDAMPPDCGMAFVIVLHLDPTRDSHLAEIMAHHTKMQVADIEDGMRIEAGHVYVITPDSYLRVTGGVCRLSRPDEARGHRFPVDVLFASLAEDQAERAICIVMSGTGHDGTEGLREVNAQGGCSLAHDPQTAKFDGMPRSAIAAGVADQILAIEDMPDFLTRYVRHGYLAAPAAIETEDAADASSLDQVLTLLRARTNEDFRGYKRSTLIRRVHRRMGLQNLDGIADYLDLLRSSSTEAAALSRDLMISVTGFFRDAQAWKSLDETVVAPLVAERDNGAPIRLWVPACATGEEAYSLGMLILERAEAAGKEFDLKIFATDSQDACLRTARSGVYPDAAMATVSPERRRRFFDQLDGTQQVRRDLRERVVFSPHNLLRDPPFSRMDIISCRNLLIYLQPEAQARVVALAHFALRENGRLFLGNAESIGRADDLFETISKKWRIYRRVGPTRHDIINFPVFSGRAGPARSNDQEAAMVPTEAPIRYGDVTRRILLERHAPAAVLTDHRGRALYFHGSTGDYLDPPTGDPTHDVLAMARDDMRPQLRTALRSAVSKVEETAFRARLRQNGAQRAVDVTITPAKAPGAAADLFLVSFEDQRDPPATANALSSDEAPSGRERALEEELRSAQAELNTTVEQMESVQEELKAYNEETTSMNEELQSTNEELETSKEELQSFNEELHSVNNQLQHKNQELEETTNTLANLLAGTDIATVFLDKELGVKWLSPAAQKLLDLDAADIGRPIGHFVLKIADENLARDAETVLTDLRSVDAEVVGDAGQRYLRRMLPYRTGDVRVEGVVINYTDITDLRQASEAADEARVFAEAIVNTVCQPLLVLDADLSVISANLGFLETFKTSRDDTEGLPIFELGDGQWNIPQLRTLLEDTLRENDAFSDFVVAYVFEGIGAKTMLLNARRLRRNGGRPDAILLAIEDTTERTQADDHRNLLIDELSHRVKNTLATVQSLANQTSLRASTLDDFQTAFDGRLQALARAHELLVAENWTGADIGQLARWTLDPYRAEKDDRIVINGPKLILTPKAGTAMVMILHELATNAAKYGALSTPDGRLGVKWRLGKRKGERVFHLTWAETAGKQIEPPTRKGFGSRLIEGSASYELEGSAKLDFRSEGLDCVIVFPWRPKAAQGQEGD